MTAQAPADLHSKRPADTSLTVHDNPVSESPAADPTHVRFSAVLLLGSLLAAGAGARLHPDAVDISASAVFAALVLFLTCLTRYTLAAQATK